MTIKSVSIPQELWGMVELFRAFDGDEEKFTSYFKGLTQKEYLYRYSLYYDSVFVLKGKLLETERATNDDIDDLSDYVVSKGVDYFNAIFNCEKEVPYSRHFNPEGFMWYFESNYNFSEDHIAYEYSQLAHLYSDKPKVTWEED